MTDLITRGLAAKRESKYIDFKSSLGLDESHSWCEIIKDIIAMANSGGGLILIGLNNNGTCSGFDLTQVLNLDSAVITDKIRKYTGVNFDEFDIIRKEKDGNPIACLLVGDVNTTTLLTLQISGLCAQESRLSRLGCQQAEGQPRPPQACSAGSR